MMQLASTVVGTYEVNVTVKMQLAVHNKELLARMKYFIRRLEWLFYHLNVLFDELLCNREIGTPPIPGFVMEENSQEWIPIPGFGIPRLQSLALAGIHAAAKPNS